MEITRRCQQLRPVKTLTKNNCLRQLVIFSSARLRRRRLYWRDHGNLVLWSAAVFAADQRVIGFLWTHGLGSMNSLLFPQTRERSFFFHQNLSADYWESFLLAMGIQSFLLCGSTSGPFCPQAKPRFLLNRTPHTLIPSILHWTFYCRASNIELSRIFLFPLWKFSKLANWRRGNRITRYNGEAIMGFTDSLKGVIGFKVCASIKRQNNQRIQRPPGNCREFEEEYQTSVLIFVNRHWNQVITFWSIVFFRYCATGDRLQSGDCDRAVSEITGRIWFAFPKLVMKLNTFHGLPSYRPRFDMPTWKKLRHVW